MNRIVIDFETYCDIDISLAGTHKYASHKSCRILCMAYQINSGPVQLWLPSMPVPRDWQIEMENQEATYSFNSTFEFLIWSYVGRRAHPEMFPEKPASHFLDIRALCLRYRMPPSLAAAATHLNRKHYKNTAGKGLIRKCCTPGYWPSENDFHNLYMYCMDDVDAANEILNNLPATQLIPKEQQLFELTLEMNMLGVPIDIVTTKAIKEYLNVYMEEMTQMLPVVSQGTVSTPGQIQKIIAFCKHHGVLIDNLQVSTVEETLKIEDLPENVRAVLEIRQLTSLNSVKKFILLEAMYNNGYVQGSLQYHGAGTGRWSGSGFQFHSLPRAKHKEPEIWIEKFRNFEPIEKPVEAAKALIRSMIMAPPGQMLIVSDYSSIENRILAWVNNDLATLQRFKDGVDQYKDMAAYLYNKSYDAVLPSERQLGKAVILGCGYQMGASRFIAVAAAYGIKLTLDQATAIIKAYRAKYYLVSQGWKLGSQAAHAAVLQRGREFYALKCTFKVVKAPNSRLWLRITLPSGRGLMYADPAIIETKFGTAVAYVGYNNTSFKMSEMTLSPGLVTENAVQAIARDVLAHGKLTIRSKMPEAKLCLSVHDEIGALIPEALASEETMSIFNTLICSPEPWRADLELKAEGYIAKRYKKG